LGAEVRDDFLGETALHKAVKSGDLATVSFVLQRGVDLQSLSQLNETGGLKGGPERGSGFVVCSRARHKLAGGGFLEAIGRRAEGGFAVALEAEHFVADADECGRIRVIESSLLRSGSGGLDGIPGLLSALVGLPWLAHEREMA
jgi:hypothetical protein